MERNDTQKPPSPPADKYDYYGSRPATTTTPGGDAGNGGINGGGPGYQDSYNAVSLPILTKPQTQQQSQSQPQQQLQQLQQQEQQLTTYPPASQYVPPPAAMVEIPPQPTMSTAGSVVATNQQPGPVGPPRGGYSSSSNNNNNYNNANPNPNNQYNSGYAANYYNNNNNNNSGYSTPVRPPAGAAATTTTGYVQSPGPMYAGNAATAAATVSTDAAVAVSKSDLRAARAAVEQGLRRLIDLQRQQTQQLQYGPGAASVPNSTAAAVQEQLRLQTGAVVRDLRLVRRAIAGMAKAAENHRFRRWLVGGLLATFVPLVRRLFRRPAGVRRAGGTSGTEYAFAKSRALVDRMLGSVQRRGGLASIAFFVFAVLYIFSNEVSLRVARTVGRRLKKLCGKIERGDEPLSEADVKLLSGWRWRVLLWGR